MFDTGEQIEEGFSSGRVVDWRTYGDKKAKPYEIIKRMEDEGIDYTPVLEIYELNFYDREYRSMITPKYPAIGNILSEYDEKSVFYFENWYEEKFKIKRDSSSFDTVWYKAVLSRDNLKRDLLEKIMEKHGMSEQRKEKARKEFEEKAVSPFEKMDRKILEFSAKRTNELDKIFFPNSEVETFDNIEHVFFHGSIGFKMRILEKTMVDDNMSYFSYDRGKYSIARSHLDDEESFFADYGSKIENCKVFDNFTDFFKEVRKLFDSNVMDNPVNNKILEDFFVETFEDIEEKKKDFNYIEEIIRKTNPDLRMYQKKNEKTGRNYFNFKEMTLLCHWT